MLGCPTCMETKYHNPASDNPAIRERWDKAHPQRYERHAVAAEGLESRLPAPPALPTRQQQADAFKAALQRERSKKAELRHELAELQRELREQAAEAALQAALQRERVQQREREAHAAQVALQAGLQRERAQQEAVCRAQRHEQAARAAVLSLHAALQAALRAGSQRELPAR